MRMLDQPLYYALSNGLQKCGAKKQGLVAGLQEERPGDVKLVSAFGRVQTYRPLLKGCDNF